MSEAVSERDDTWLLRLGSLFYTVFWFAEPIRRRSFAVWVGFLAFYALFLTGYLRIVRCGGTEQRIWLAILFVLGYAYYPFNPNAGGEFVFAVVVSGFVIQRASTVVAFRVFGAILALQATGLLLETWLFHLPWTVARSALFFMFVLGLSNFTYARQVFTSRRLRRANEEIERLTQLAERERIARDLHDLLGHTLTVIAVKSDIANRLFTSHPTLAHAEIAEVESTARDALREVREAVTGYRSNGFLAEVTRVRRALGSAGVAFTTEVQPIEITPATGALLSVILREAVTNVIRHASATECHLRLDQGESLRLTIEDNGTTELGPEGNGIRGMRERIEQVGGTLRVEPRQIGGVRVLAKLSFAGGEDLAQR